MENISVERLHAGDCKELVAFLDEVFTAQNNAQMDFANLFPRIFVDTEEAMQWYYAIKENGKIVGTAASHPFHYRVGGQTLKVSSGGNVAVSLSCRNRGFMQKLMHKINEDLVAEDFDFAILHGDRKRYRTFGFERCGVEYTVSFTKASVALSGAEAEDTLSDLREEPEAVLEEVMALFHSLPGSVERRKEEFIPAILTHYGIPLAIRNRSGELIGYTALSVKEKLIRELYLKNPADLPHVIATLVAYADGSGLDIRLPEYDALTQKAVEICSRYQIIQPGNFQIVRFDNVVRAFMKAKSAYAPLAEGSLVIHSALFGAWKISNQGGAITVEKTDEAADLVIADTKIYTFLFGPGNPLLAGVDTTALTKEKKALVANWFPLPLYYPHLT